MNITAVPAIYYHSVKYKIKKNWVHPQTILLLTDFYRHVKFFQNLGIKTFFMDDLYNHLNGEQKLPIKSLIIHFDDGYLDNYIFAFPLLKKYCIKATIWINPDFIDNNDNIIRPNLEDYWDGKISLEELNQYDGYLSWEEMRLMEKSGFVDIQSHTLTHNRYPVSKKIIDFVNPDTKIDWLYWNLFPYDKPHFLTNPSHNIPLGYPIYESGEGNVARIFQETGQLTNSIIDFVDRNGKEKFFNRSDWKEILFSMAEKLKIEFPDLYTQESEFKYKQRIEKELSESKRIIEDKLSKKVNHVCWPYGGWNETTIKLSQSVGYLTNTAKGQKNVFNKSFPHRVDRIALDNPKYQNLLFSVYALFKYIKYKFN